MVCDRLRNWNVTGAWRCESSAGASIARLSYMLAEELHFALRIYTVTEVDRLRKPEIEDPKDTATILCFSRKRAARLVQTGALDLWQPRWKRVPLTKEAISKIVNIRYEEDELKAIKTRGHGCSAPGGIFRKIGLTRHIIQQVFDELSYSRQAQTVLCSVICATRFKYAGEGKLVPTKCRKRGRRNAERGSRDSYPDNRSRPDNLGIYFPRQQILPRQQIQTQQIQILIFLEELTKSEGEIGMSRPIPLLAPTAQHMELDCLDATASDSEPLGFEIDN